MPGTHPPIFWLGGRQREYPRQYYYVLLDIADQYWLLSVRSASSRFHSAIRRHQFASVRQADSRLTRLVPPQPWTRVNATGSKVVVKNPATPGICCRTTLRNVNVRKQAINDKLQRSVATYLTCGGIVNNQIKKGLLLSLSVKIFNRLIFGKVPSKNVVVSWTFLIDRLLAVFWPGAQSARDHV